MIKTLSISRIVFSLSGRVLGHTFLAANLIFAVGGQLLLKSAMLQENMHPDTWLSYLLIFCGLGIYAIGIGFWMLCLGYLDLSYAYPFTGLAHVAVLGTSWWFFADNISLQRVSGVILVCLGSVLITTRLRNES